MLSISFKTGVRATTLLVLLGAAGPAQEVQELPWSPACRNREVSTTGCCDPIDLSRKPLESAITPRPRTSSPQKRPRIPSHTLLLVLADGLFLDQSRSISVEPDDSFQLVWHCAVRTTSASV